MKSQILARAVGAALILSGGTAAAYVPTSNTDADIVIYWGGATASTVSAQELAVGALCDANPHVIYVRTESDANPARKNLPGNDWAVACETAAAGATVSGLPNGKRILVVKRDRGGSGVGVGPLQTNTPFTFLTISAANCPDTPTPGVNGAPNVVGPGGGLVPLIGCPNTIAAATLYSTSRLIEVGTSDIEPDKFIGINTPVVDSVNQPFLPGVAFGAVNALSGLTFNTPVTLPLYLALQSAQFPATSVCNPANVGYTAAVVVPDISRPVTNGESEACMPSLTKQEINSVLTGRITNWNLFLNSAGAPIVPGSFPTRICRRVEGSGTQATINALMSNYPCDPNLNDLTFDLLLPRSVAGPNLVLNSGSSDVATCLTTLAGEAANPYAIGVLSVEGRNNNNSAPYRYIKVDGIAPTLRNIHAGDYYFYAQQTCQRRDYAALAANAPVGADDTTANRVLAYDALCSSTKATSLGAFGALVKLNNPQNAANCTSGANTSQCGSLYQWGQSGWLATPTSAQVYDNVLAASTRPINAFTREVSPGRVNICQHPVKSTAPGNTGRGVIVAPNPTWTP